MSMRDRGSITRCIDGARAGEGEAAQRLWERYFQQLVHLARRRLQTRRRGAVADEEDVALSAFDSFCRGVERGRFPLLNDRDDLWKLLVVLTVRKASDQIQHWDAQKRGGGWAACATDAFAEDGWHQIVDREPSPELAAMLTEEYRRLRDDLAEDSLRRVLDLRLEGYTCAEIAQRLGCAVRTVTRKLEMIRTACVREAP